MISVLVFCEMYHLKTIRSATNFTLVIFLLNGCMKLDENLLLYKDNRGCQCYIKVPTRWRLRSLLLRLPRWRVIKLLRCTLRLARNSVNSDAVYAERWYPQHGYRGRKADGLYLQESFRFNVAVQHQSTSSLALCMTLVRIFKKTISIARHFCAERKGKMIIM